MPAKPLLSSPTTIPSDVSWKNPSVRRFLAMGLLASPLVLTNCATLRSWFRSAGTYAVAAPEAKDLNGRGEVQGALYLTPALSDVMMEGRGTPVARGLQTPVTVEPLGLEVETDVLGEFVLPHLDPGDYHITFSDPGGRTIWADFAVAADQSLTIQVWVQWDSLRQGYMSEGTYPTAMYPGANGAYSISSGSSGGGRSGSGDKGGGGKT
jgi:hypothetical protein